MTGHPPPPQPYLVQGVARLKYDGGQEEEEEGLGRELLVEGQVLVGQQRDDGVIEYTHHKACKGRWKSAMYKDHPRPPSPPFPGRGK